MGPNIPINTYPSAAAIARTTTYPDFQRNLPHRLSPTKLPTVDNKGGVHKTSSLFLSASATGKENRVPTPFPPEIVGSVPRGALPNWDSDISMRDPSSIFSSFSRPGKVKNSPVPTPATSDSVKSRKEGFAGSGSSRRGAEAADNGKKPGNSSFARLGSASDQQSELCTRAENAMTQPFVPGHKSAESLDSMGRVEKQLFSALGEELGTSFSADDGFGSRVDVDAQSSPHAFLRGLEGSPTQKRKRKGTLGGERGRSPIMKMGRESLEKE